MAKYSLLALSLLAPGARAIVCSSFDEASCSGCVSSGECFWNAGKCDTDPESEKCGEVGITGGDTSAKVYSAIGTKCSGLFPDPFSSGKAEGGADECKARCDADERCASWEFQDFDDQGASSDRECYLRERDEAVSFNLKLVFTAETGACKLGPERYRCCWYDEAVLPEPRKYEQLGRVCNNATYAQGGDMGMLISQPKGGERTCRKMCDLYGPVCEAWEFTDDEDPSTYPEIGRLDPDGPGICKLRSKYQKAYAEETAVSGPCVDEDDRYVCCNADVDRTPFPSAAPTVPPTAAPTSESDSASGVAPGLLAALVAVAYASA
mmetsp:Transcript_12618/g.37524  ORF Transcript_12618/g.37524 Transcript_12618/m.37524 type:complete len:322 (-) Transcript_12618:65-1030(-)